MVANASSNSIGGRLVRQKPRDCSQYARIVDAWVEEIGLDSATYGTHSMRGTKASLIVRYLGIEVEDALELSEQTDA